MIERALQLETLPIRTTRHAVFAQWREAEPSRETSDVSRDAGVSGDALNPIAGIGGRGRGGGGASGYGARPREGRPTAAAPRERPGSVARRNATIASPPQFRAIAQFAISMFRADDHKLLSALVQRRSARAWCCRAIKHDDNLNRGVDNIRAAMQATITKSARTAGGTAVYGWRLAYP